MSNTSTHNPTSDSVRRERLEDLLTERACWGLSDADQRELERLLDSDDLDDELGTRATDDVLDRAVAAVALRELESAGLDEMPASLHRSSMIAASAYLAAREGGTGAAPAAALPIARGGHGTDHGDGSARFAWAGWVVAAASLLIAVVLTQTPPEPSPRDRLAELRSRGDVVEAGWAGIDAAGLAEAPHERDKGVTGEVVWSESDDRGVMRISGIEPNEPGKDVYQLWIFDRTRDDGTLAQRPVDGGVFEINERGEALVPIDAKLPVGEAFLFAVTREPPGGVVVSDRDIVFVASVG